MGEITDERQTAASSPLAQSDSDGSTSSFDLGSSVAGLAINAAASKSKEGLVKCRWSDCGQWFEHLDLLASHVTRVHAQSGRAGLFYCGWEGCSRGDRGFNARYKMLVHVRTHTNEKPHHCFKCDKSFSRAENLKIHARSHTGERPYVCPIAGCGKAYSNSSDRFKHTRTHSIDKPYICKVPGCPKRYTDPSSLRKHVKTYRHYPDADKPEAATEAPMRELTPPKVLKRDSTGAAKPSFADRCEEDAAAVTSGKDLFVNGQGTQYDLFRSWLNADLSVLSRSLPLGLSLWNHPMIQREDYGRPNARFEAHGGKHSRMDSTSSDEAMDAGMKEQECPLDLTIHRASTRT